MCFLLYTSDHLRLVCDLVVFLSLRVYLFKKKKKKEFTYS